MNKVDLFIPTFNRPVFLKRLLNYYSNKKVKYRIIVVDSSSMKNKKLNKKTISEFKSLDLSYVDEFPSAMISHIKFGRMLKYAKSKYTVFCADDDFLIPRGIDECVQFLEKHPDYAAAHGSYIAFYIYSGLLSVQRFIWRYIYSIKEIRSSSPLDRVCFHIENYNQVLWAVRRTEMLKKIYREFLRSKTDPILFGELLPDVLTVAYGKIKRVYTFYSARQAFSTAYSYWPSLQDAIRKGIYESEFLKFKKCLVNNIVANQPRLIKKREEVSSRIDDSMVKYLQLSNQEHLMGRVNLILKKLPSQISNLVRKLHIIYLYSKENVDEIGDISLASSKYNKEIYDLKEAVLE